MVRSCALLLLLHLPLSARTARGAIVGFTVDEELCSGQVKSPADVLSQTAVCNAWLSELTILKQTVRFYGIRSGGKLRAKHFKKKALPSHVIYFNVQ